MNKNKRNKISTPSYFLKRLKDNKFVTFRIFNEYALSDPRRWTVLVEPGKASVYITCYENKDFANEVMFEFNDGGSVFPKNFSIKTDSIEVIITHLLERGVEPSASKISNANV
jgi:hypothetical protein